MITNSVWTQIREEYYERLKNISTTNGYSTDIIKVEKGRVNPFEDSDLPGVNFWKTDDVANDKTYTRQSRTLRIGIEIYTCSEDDDVDVISDGFMSDLLISAYRSPNAPHVEDDPMPMFVDKQFSMSFDLLRPVISQGSAPRVGVFGIISFNYAVNNLNPNILL